MLCRDAILSAQDLPTEDVNVREWNGMVRVRTLTGTERDAFEAASIQSRGRSREINLANLRARLAVLCIVDANGNRIFSDKDAEALGKKSAKALAEVYNIAARLNGLSVEDVEELAKNSESAPLAASVSS